MKFIFLFILAFFSLNSHSQNISQEELKEIIVWGSYTRENQEEIKKAEEELRFMGALKEGESVEEKLVHLQLGKERYERFGQQFCYDTTGEGVKAESHIFNPDLRVRLYNEEGHILSEDFLRDEFPKDNSYDSYEWKVISYVPYHPEGHSLQIVRIEGETEIFLDKLGFYTLEKLKELIDKGKFYAYRYDGDCYKSSPSR